MNDSNHAAEADQTKQYQHKLLTIFLFLTFSLYVCTFWGGTSAFMPKFLMRFRYFVYSMPRFMCDNRNMHLLGVKTINAIAGILLPGLIYCIATRKGIGEFGFRLPNRVGWRWTYISPLLWIPVGFLLVKPVHHLPLAAVFNFRYLLGQLGMISEHTLICGIALAAFLPGRNLPEQHFVSSDGNWLRSLGLAQQPLGASIREILAWFGLDGDTLSAIIGSALLFWAVHLGKQNVVELYVAFPGGMAAAYITMRSSSVWPAVISHWALNIVPMLSYFLFNHWR